MSVDQTDQHKPEHEPREDEQEDGTRREGSDDERKLGGRILSASPLIWVVLVAVIAWALWATLAGDHGDRPTVRAVVIPTGDAQREVVAVPCSALGGGQGSTGGDPSAVPGAITAVLPRGGGERVVAVTGCTGGGGGGASRLSAEQGGRTALIVLPAGTEVPKGDQRRRMLPGYQIGSVTRLESLPDAEAIVIPACPKRRGNQTGTVSAQPSGGGVVLVPCPPAS